MHTSDAQLDGTGLAETPSTRGTIGNAQPGLSVPATFADGETAAIDDLQADEGASPETVAAADRSLSQRLWTNVGAQVREFPADFFSDTRALFSVNVAWQTGLGAGLSAISANNWDDPLRRDTAQHARRWGGVNNVLDVVGHPATHLGGAGVLRLASAVSPGEHRDEFGKSLLNALLLTDASVLALKHIFDTTRPTGAARGFPSGHVASSFAVAAVVEDQYGTTVGLGAYTLAGLVGWHRIDNRNHDLSDVLFGAILGCAVGKAVARNHRFHRMGVSASPYSDPETGTTGVSVQRRF